MESLAHELRSQINQAGRQAYDHISDVRSQNNNEQEQNLEDSSGVPETVYKDDHSDGNNITQEGGDSEHDQLDHETFDLDYGVSGQ